MQGSDVLLGAVVGFISAFGLEQAKTWFKRYRDQKDLRKGLYHAIGSVMAELNRSSKRLHSMTATDETGVMLAGPNNLIFASRRYKAYVEAFPLVFIALPEADALEMVFSAVASATDVMPGTKTELQAHIDQLRSSIEFFFREGSLDQELIEQYSLESQALEDKRQDQFFRSALAEHGLLRRKQKSRLRRLLMRAPK